MPSWPGRFVPSDLSSSSPPLPPALLDRQPPSSNQRLLDPSQHRSGRLPPSHARSRSHHAGPQLYTVTPKVGLRRSEGDLLSAAEADAAQRHHGPAGAISLAGVRGVFTPDMPNPAQHGETAKGQCMCCDSTVRWPSNLSMFRCTICLSVNDLVPAKPMPTEDGTTHKKVQPISVQSAKDVIRNATGKFLKARELLFDQLEGVDDIASSIPYEHPTNNISGASETRSTAPPTVRPPNDDDPGLPPARPPPPPPPPSTPLHIPERRGSKGNHGFDGGGPSVEPSRRSLYIECASKMFKPLEEYLVKAFGSWECLNASFVDETFSTEFYIPDPRAPKDSGRKDGHKSSVESDGLQMPPTETAGEKEALMLTVGRVVWKDRDNFRRGTDRRRPSDARASRRIPVLDWNAVNEFYDLVLNAGTNIAPYVYTTTTITPEAALRSSQRRINNAEMASALGAARVETTNALLRATETLLKRPGRPLQRPDDIRFLLLILANPLLYPGAARRVAPMLAPSSVDRPSRSPPTGSFSDSRRAPRAVPPTKARDTIGSGPASHPGIVKRVLCLLGNLPNECHHHLVSWFSVMPEQHFKQLVELGGSFTTYRIARKDGQPHSRSASSLVRGTLPYEDDWQLKGTAKLMSLLHQANNNVQGRRKGPHRLIVPSNAFYNMRLDYCDIVADFNAWEAKDAKFCFCHFPFYLSMGSKIQVLEHDARRQMEAQARNAFISNISTSGRAGLNQYMHLKVRRECLVEDSLKGISESTGTLHDIKKGLKVEFAGEDGIDAGGLKKEWFLLVARNIFDPAYGLFVYDDDSRYCYFNPYTFESSEEFFLVGVLVGLAIYNSTILDIALPPYVFKKLIHFTPTFTIKGAMETRARREPFRRGLDDLAVLHPALAKGLQQLLDFDGDVQETFCRDFVAERERFGHKELEPLCPNGENRPVTNSNRKEFVDLYVKHILDTSVSRQFEPFKRGFYTVAGGNALGLFGPEEIELLVRGSEEPLDVQALKAVAIYDGWGNEGPPETHTVVKWFWGFFEKLTPTEQRMLLSFVTGSDRIPAMGATNLTIKVVCLGPDCDRFPVARTCFNQISIYKYKKRDKLENLLWRAVTESEGFGLK